MPTPAVQATQAFEPFERPKPTRWTWRLRHVIEAGNEFDGRSQLRRHFQPSAFLVPAEWRRMLDHYPRRFPGITPTEEALLREIP